MNGSCRGIMEYKIGKMMDNGGQLSSQSPHFLAGDRSGPPTEQGSSPGLWFSHQLRSLNPQSQRGPATSQGLLSSAQTCLFLQTPPHRPTNGHDPAPSNQGPPPPLPSQQPPNLITYFGFSSQEPQWQKSKNTKSTVSLTSSGRRRVNWKYISYLILI